MVKEKVKLIILLIAWRAREVKLITLLMKKSQEGYRSLGGVAPEEVEDKSC